MKRLRAFAVLLTLVSLASLSTMFGQYEIPLTITDGANTTVIYMGIFPAANFGIHPADNFNGHQEAELPPVPPAGVFDTRFVWPRSGASPNPPTGFGVGSAADYRPYLGVTQKDTFRVNNQLGAGPGIQISWPAGLASQFAFLELRDQPTSGATHTVNMLTATSVDFSDTDPPNFRVFVDGLIIPPPPGSCFGFPAWGTPLNANVGSSATRVINASNIAQTAMNVTGILSDNPDWVVVAPATPFVVPATGSVAVTVQFSPTASGPSAANLTFTHDPTDPACGGGNTTTILAVTGTAISNALLFANDARTHLEDAITYQDTLQLAYQGPGSLKALQVRLVLNGNGTSGLSLQGVNRGSDLPAGNFSFATQIHYGPPNGDGTSDDTVSIVFYGNGSNAIPAGSTLNDLIRFRYGAGHVSPNGTQLVHVQLLDVHGSLPNGDAVTVSADADQNITINPRGINGFLYGDVDTSGTVDIVDLLLVVDYILGRNPTPFVFALADLAPWTLGAPAPSPDGVVNVQDLSLLQNIILTGQYPDGSPSYRPGVTPSPVVNSVAKGKTGNSTSTLTPGKDVKLTFYISPMGIAVRMESIVKVKGIQLEFGRIPSVPTTMQVTTILGEGPYVGIDNKLRVLMYNQVARLVDPGDMMVGNMPFGIVAPEVVTLNKYIVVGERNNKIQEIEVEIVQGEAPELPVEYMLHQNYPNPFNPSTSVKFSVPELSDVKIAIYNLLGQELQVLFDQKMERGTRVAVWNGRDRNGVEAASGTYIVRMIAGSYIESRKMMFVK